MKLVEVHTRKEQKRYLAFRKEIYHGHPHFVDNNLFMIRELFAGKTSFDRNKKVIPIWVEEDGVILCQCMIIYTHELKDYIQIGFFESREQVQEAVTLLMGRAAEIGRGYGCTRLVVGLNGHVNYGLGLLASDFDKRNSFAASFNPEYYNAYFLQAGCQEIPLHTYRINKLDNRLDRYDAIFRKIDRSYTFRYFDKKQFNEYARIYTDLNNQCFDHHPYYYQRTYEEDREMLKELFLFMKEDSLIFAFYEGEPVAFIMWYPDFNELARPGEAFGVKHYFRNLLFHKRIHTAKVMEYGVLSEYRKVGLPLALIHQVLITLQKYPITRVETSWIMEENRDSAGFCQGVCDEVNTKYAVYEKAI